MYLRDKVVLITGGTGSFGKEYVKCTIGLPKKLIIFSRDELKQHEMQCSFDHPSLRYFIGDVRDLPRLRRAMTGVDIVIHAAALKQIPSCEYNPFETIKTNVLGTQNVAEAAIDCGVKKAVFLSSDKAVDPVNLYGMTKGCAEKLWIQANNYTANTLFSCTRYGNVAGSRGSVIPLFLAQRESGVLTVTSPSMTRFWMTLREAVGLVAHCIEEMKGGEIFVPRLPSMYIVDLATLIAPDAEIEYVGIRPGEKVSEALISLYETRRTYYDGGHGLIIIPEGRVTDLPPVGRDFMYTSDDNDWWLDHEAMRRMINELDLPEAREWASSV